MLTPISLNLQSVLSSMACLVSSESSALTHFSLRLQGSQAEINKITASNNNITYLYTSDYVLHTAYVHMRL